MTRSFLTAETAGKIQFAEIAQGRCLRARLSNYNCTLCVDGCHMGALITQKGRVEINHDKCTGCGRCTAVCPSETFFFDQVDLNKILKDGIAPDTVFACLHQKQSFPNELRIPCVAAFSLEALMYMGLKVSGTLYFNIASCQDCINFEVVKPFLDVLTQIESTFTSTLLANFILIKDASNVVRITTSDRRSFLSELGSNIYSLVASQSNKQDKRAKRTDPTKRTIPKKTALLANAITSAKATVADNLVAQCTPTISLADSCIMCPRCAGICPTGALKLERQSDRRKRLSFSPTKCTGCGLCAQFCNEKSLTVQQAPIFGYEL